MLSFSVLKYYFYYGNDNLSIDILSEGLLKYKINELLSPEI